MPTALLKKYFAYARQRISPVLTDGALNEIKDFYVQMRGLGATDERIIKAIPISARQLEALVRMSEASARVRLAEKVTRKDARRAIDLLTYCLVQVGLDRETGRIDIDRISTGIPASQRDRIFAIKSIIMELEGKIGKAIPIDDIIKSALDKGISETDAEEVVERLKRSGDVYEPRSGFVSRM
ncbi:minichromosome maintenance protein MCM [Candidatus Woesearchaeota archaeon]|nr:minichromosome maintenance protein MCM [Candidatus Woesearchaeota archaeon]